MALHIAHDISPHQNTCTAKLPLPGKDRSGCFIGMIRSQLTPTTRGIVIAKNPVFTGDPAFRKRPVRAVGLRQTVTD